MAVAIGRVVLWLFVGLALARGVGDIFADSDERSEPVSAAAATGWPDDRARALAARFAQAYLSTRPGEEVWRRRRLAGMVLPGLEERLEAEPSRHGDGASVMQATVAGTDRVAVDRALVTVACVLRDGNVWHLLVPIARDAKGAVAVVGLPSFGPPPALADVAPDEPVSLPAEDADAVSRLSRAFLGAYLSGDAGRIAYLIAPGSRVAATSGLELVQITAIGQLAPREGPRRRLQVGARVRVQSSGAVYAAAFWIDVVRRDRWYVTRIAGGERR